MMNTSDFSGLQKGHYNDNVKRRQEAHLKGILHRQNEQPCLHDACSQCVGTGIKKDGSTCLHYISCPCVKCTPRF